MPDKPTYSADSSCFIEWLKPKGERHHPEKAVERIRGIIKEAEAGVCALALSAFTLVEVRKLSGEKAEEFRRAVRRMSPNIYPLDVPLALQAAELGDRLRLGNGDAILLATAVVARAEVFYTLDGRLLNLNSADIWLQGDGGKILKPADGFKIVKP